MSVKLSDGHKPREFRISNYTRNIPVVYLDQSLRLLGCTHSSLTHKNPTGGKLSNEGRQK